MNGTVGEMEQLSSWPLNLISTHLLKVYTLNFESEDQHLVMFLSLDNTDYVNVNV